MQEVLVDLSRAHGNLGDYKKQLECVQRALPICEKQYGEDHIEYAIIIVDLGRAHGNLGDYNKQLECIETCFTYI